MGKFQYEDFKKPTRCKTCHKGIYQEWEQSLMSQSFTHHWDDVEYFKLALPHALKLDKVSGVKGGCVACHSPLAFLTGDIPPKPPAAGTRANEGVSCEICHSITGSTEKEPFNFSYIIEPGKVKFGPRSDGRSSFHGVKYSEFIRSPEDILKLGIQFEKDSIIFFQTMQDATEDKKGRELIGQLINEEKEHLRKLSLELKRLND